MCWMLSDDTNRSLIDGSLLTWVAVGSCSCWMLSSSRSLIDGTCCSLWQSPDIGGITFLIGLRALMKGTEVTMFMHHVRRLKAF
jgi:hypothetical protein